MDREQRYEVNAAGELVTGRPVTLSQTERKEIIEKMFSVYGWTYTLVDEISNSHFLIELSNSNLKITKRYHLYHGNVRKEDPERNREEKKIQLGTENDPRNYFDDGIILGFYVYDSKELQDVTVVAWPIERQKNYPKNPSLRVNMKNDILPARNSGMYIDRTTGKKLIVFRPEFIYYYLQIYKGIQYSTDISATDSEGDSIDAGNGSSSLVFGANILFYGVPGAGKSRMIDGMVVQERSERVVFHPDYTYSDFIGQILPRVIDDKLKYVFEPGSFTKMLKKAYDDPENMYFLIIEEINRGNAPAIFGDIFQLLDRDEDGAGKYHISNYDIATNVFGDEDHIIKMPANLTLLATMNTSDQNVFTLDTAFQRRWEMHLIKNDVTKAIHADQLIEGSNISWGTFASVTNAEIIRFGENIGSSEDKRLGAYFVRFNELSRDKFPEKVLKYLWDDVFKMDHDTYFNEAMKSFDNIMDAFEETTVQTDILKRVLKYSIYLKMADQDTEAEVNENPSDEEGQRDEQR